MAANKETSIGVKLVADLRNYQTNMSKAQSQTKTFSKNVKSGLGDVKSSFSQLMRGDITALPTFFKSATGAAGGFAKGLHGVKAALIGTGIGALLVGLGLAIASITQYFKGTEEGQIVFKNVMSKINAYVQPVLSMFGKLGKALVQLFSRDFKGAWETAKSAINGVTAAVEENLKQYPRLTELQTKLVQKRREAAAEEARLQSEISELRNKANDEEMYSANERAKFIASGLTKQNELARIKNELAEDELELQKLINAQGDNTIADNDKENELQKRLKEIKKENSDQSRRMLETQQRITREVNKEVEAQQRVNEQIAERANNSSLSTVETKQVASLDTSGVDTDSLDDMGSYLDANTEKLARFREGLSQTVEASDQLSIMSDSFGQLGGAIGGVAGHFMNMASTILGMIPQLIMQVTALTAAEVSSSQAKTAAAGSAAIAKGTEQSQSVPFPFNIIALAATIGSIISALATKPPALASGGIAFGDTLARVGEYAGASSNPEVIAPLNKLKDMLPAGEGGRDRIFISKTRISKGDIVIAYEEGKKAMTKRNGK